MQHPGPHYGVGVPGIPGVRVPTGATAPDCCYPEWGPPQPIPTYSTPMKEMEGKFNTMFSFYLIKIY